MRMAMMAAVLLAGCSSQPAEKAAPENDAVANVAGDNLDDGMPAAPEKRSYVGRWASKQALCATAPWTFAEKHLDTPDGISCDFEAVQERPGGYDVTASCMVDGAKRNETIALRFAVSSDLMLVDSKLFRPAGLEACKGDAGVVTVPVTAVDNTE
jgi:hypothetical protein